MIRTLLHCIFAISIAALTGCHGAGCSAASTPEEWGSCSGGASSVRLSEAAPDAQHMSTELVAVHKSLGVEWVQPGTTDGLYPSHYVVWLKNNSVIFVALNDVRGGFHNDLNYVKMSAYGIWRQSDSNRDQFLVQRHIEAIEHYFFQRYKEAQQEAEVPVDIPTDANLRPLVDKRINIQGTGLRCQDGPRTREVTP